MDALRQRVAELEGENADLRELADEQVRQLADLAGGLPSWKMASHRATPPESLTPTLMVPAATTGATA